MPEAEAMHLLRRPNLHLVVELSELCDGWTSDEGAGNDAIPDTAREEAATHGQLQSNVMALVCLHSSMGRGLQRSKG